MSGVTADSGQRTADETCWTADGFNGCFGAVIAPGDGGGGVVFNRPPRPPKRDPVKKKSKPVVTIGRGTPVAVQLAPQVITGIVEVEPYKPRLPLPDSRRSRKKQKQLLAHDEEWLMLG